jgi:phosphoribosyl 1,2-cyclic phosphodiesterase
LQPADESIRVTFWGVRGSIPTPGCETTRYGGNTLCLEVGFADSRRVIIIDAGSGIRRLGDALHGRPGGLPGLRIDLLFTHTHLDHILGLPFFRPLYDKRTRITLYGPVISPEDRLEKVIGAQLSYRYFPVRQVELAADITYVDLREGVVDLGDGIQVSATYLNHPLLCMGYRIEYRGRSLCTAFDTEPFRNLFITDPGHPDYDEWVAREGDEAAREADLRMKAFFRGADLLIHDGQFTEDEYRAGRAGWGHSSIEHAVGVAQACGARRLALVHHDPMRSDEEMDLLAARYAAAPAPGGSLSLRVCFAHEGLSIVL